MSWTPEEVDDAERIVNDIAERIDNRESRAALRQALAIYADKLQGALDDRITLASEQTLKKLQEYLSFTEALKALQARYDADMAIMNQRLQERTETMLARLQAKTQREGFVPVEVLREAATRAGKGTMNGMETWHFRAEDVAILQPHLNPNKEP